MEREAVRRAADGRTDVVARVRPYRRGDGTTVWLHGFAITLHRSERPAASTRCASSSAPGRLGPPAARPGRPGDRRASARSGVRCSRGDPIDDVLHPRVRQHAGADAGGRGRAARGRGGAGPAPRRAHAVPPARSACRGALVDDEFGGAVREHRLMTATIGPDTVAVVGGPGGLARGLRRPGAHGARAGHAARREASACWGSGARTARSARPISRCWRRFAQGSARPSRSPQGRAELERLRVLEVRQAIARDLHDEVIQDLIGLRLQLVGLAAGSPIRELARSIEEVRDELNRTTMRLRDVVAGLQEEPDEHFEDPVRALTGSRAQRQGLEWTRRHQWGPSTNWPATSGPTSCACSTSRSPTCSATRRASRVDVQL